MCVIFINEKIRGYLDTYRYIYTKKKTFKASKFNSLEVVYCCNNSNIQAENLSRRKEKKVLDNSRNIQQMFKVSLVERQEIQRIMIEENLSLSDVIRKAIR